MVQPSEAPELDRLRELLQQRAAQRAAGRAVPEDAAERIARVLAAAEPEPAACAAIQEQLPEAVAAELRGERLATALPEVHRHLLICPTCSAFYADLLELELGPALTPLPAPDLAALRWPTAGEPLRRFVAQRGRQLLARLALLPAGFDELLAAFFEAVDELGERLTWSPATTRAFAFAGEGSAAARLLLATWQATLAVRDGLAARPGMAADRAGFEQLVRAAARDAARRNRLARATAERFVETFAQLTLTPDTPGSEGEGNSRP
jgi:hypothetical protein